MELMSYGYRRILPLDVSILLCEVLLYPYTFMLRVEGNIRTSYIILKININIQASESKAMLSFWLLRTCC